ncbi:MAG TPA: type II toxin-antitoxin system HicB family antitoxin [Usitatibacteraceae bacterium]
MNTMKYRGYTARIDFDERDNVFAGDIVGMSERLTFHGASVDELRGDFEFAVDHYLAACAAAGQKPERQASGKLLIRIPPDIHAAAGVRAAAEGKSLNQWIAETLTSRLRAD